MESADITTRLATLEIRREVAWREEEVEPRTEYHVLKLGKYVSCGHRLVVCCLLSANELSHPMYSAIVHEGHPDCKTLCMEPYEADSGILGAGGGCDGRRESNRETLRDRQSYEGQAGN